MIDSRKVVIALLSILSVVSAVGCKKKVPPPPPPPAIPAPVVAQFVAEPASIQSGSAQSSTLRWNVTGSVSSVSIDHGVGTVETSGTSAVHPNESTTYTLTATGQGGTTTASARVTVTPPPAPVIAQFVAEPASIPRGQSSVLRWQVSGAVTSLSISPSPGAVQGNSGTTRVQPDNTTAYTLTTTGPGGAVTRSVSVTVIPPAPIIHIPTIEERIFSEVADAFFDYDKSELRADARDVLTQDADALKSHPGRISPTPRSWWRATATSAARPSTTSVWATAAPARPRISWCNWAFPPTG